MNCGLRNTSSETIARTRRVDCGHVWHQPLIGTTESRIVNANLLKEILGPIAGFDGLKNNSLTVATNGDDARRKLEPVRKSHDLSVAVREDFRRGHDNCLPVELILSQGRLPKEVYQESRQDAATTWPRQRDAQRHARGSTSRGAAGVRPGSAAAPRRRHSCGNRAGWRTIRQSVRAPCSWSFSRRPSGPARE